MPGLTDAAVAADLSLAYQAAMKATGDRLGRVLLGMLAGLEPWNLSGQWLQRLPEAVGAFTAAQWTAAAMADPYLRGILDARGSAVPAEGVVAPAAFGGVAASGLPLETLLSIPVARADQALVAGLGRDAAMRGAGTALSMYAQTEVADAARSSVRVSMVSHRVPLYIRTVGALCCSRCAILAGRVYKTSVAFERHPRCHCGMEPLSEVSQAQIVTPEQLLREGRITDLTAEEKQALDLGADLNQVVNAKRGMSSAGDRFTTTGTTRRAIGGARILAQGMDLARGAAPGGIYSNFTVSRAEVSAFTAKYGPLMRRGNQFARLSPTGVTTAAYARTSQGRLSVAEIMRTEPTRKGQLTALVNNGYLLRVPKELAA